MQNVNYPNGAAPSGMRRPLGSHGAGVPQGTLGGPNSGPCNTCYVQWGTEVKKLSLPLANPPYFDGELSYPNLFCDGEFLTELLNIFVCAPSTSCNTYSLRFLLY